jgi:hypothetical protein
LDVTVPLHLHVYSCCEFIVGNNNHDDDGHDDGHDDDGHDDDT